MRERGGGGIYIFFYVQQKIFFPYQITLNEFISDFQNVKDFRWKKTEL